ncbi:MAG: type II methionyl aminopeptidase [Nanoarchaeota archaeon]
MAHEDWVNAGKISAQVREYAKTLVKPGTRLFEVAEKIEAKIIELGGEIGFPVNISMDHIAAHYTPFPNDELTFKDQLVKIDIGVQVNGAIGDSAFTIDLSGKNQKLVEASEKALENATAILKEGITLGQIGKVIQDTINSYGFTPIKNLSGHGLDYFTVHCPPQIPNYNTGDETTLKKGMYFAIEPFATDGSGLVKESGEASIFSQSDKKPVRDMGARKLLKDISSKNGLPFATRHFAHKYSEGRLKLALRQLKLAGNVKDYPPLVEAKKGKISQAEHSFYIDESGEIIVLTK